MKIRMGHVSNSSSSSFYVKIDKELYENAFKLRAYLHTQGQELEDKTKYAYMIGDHNNVRVDMFLKMLHSDFSIDDECASFYCNPLSKEDYNALKDEWEGDEEKYWYPAILKEPYDEEFIYRKIDYEHGVTQLLWDIMWCDSMTSPKLVVTDMGG